MHVDERPAAVVEEQLVLDHDGAVGRRAGRFS